MKRLLFSLFTLALFNVNAQNNTVNALKFISTQAFEQFIDSKSLANLQSIDGFTTYQALKTTFAAESTPPAELSQNLAEDDYDVSNDTPPADDKNDYSAIPFLSDILNADKAVVIGNWIVKVDLENDRALVLNTAFSNQYSDLVAGNTGNANILTFSTEDDGIEMLNQLDNGVPMTTLKLWCSDRNAIGKKDDRFVYNGNRHRLDMKVVYQRAFILFSLEGKAKTQKRFLRIWWHDGNGNASMSNINLAYEVRCKKSGLIYNGDPCQFECLPGYTTGSTSHYQPYLSTRALKKYLYAIDFVSTHGNGHVEIKDGY